MQWVTRFSFVKSCDRLGREASVRLDLRAGYTIGPFKTNENLLYTKNYTNTNLCSVDSELSLYDCWRWPIGINCSRKIYTRLAACLCRCRVIFEDRNNQRTMTCYGGWTFIYSWRISGSCDTDYKCLTSKSLVKHVLLFKQQGASVRGGGHAVLNLPRAWKNMKHERWCFSPMKRCELWSVYISLWRQKDVEYPALEDKS